MCLLLPDVTEAGSRTDVSEPAWFYTWLWLNVQLLGAADDQQDVPPHPTCRGLLRALHAPAGHSRDICCEAESTAAGCVAVMSSGAG